MPIDATGDMRTDLLGLSTGSKPQLQLWNNTWAASNATNVFGV
jgi:integrin alpha FG-GAP repeat containing protein 1